MTPKNLAVYAAFVLLAVFGVLGWARAESGSGGNADGAAIDELYQAVFHRPADSDGKRFHLGRDFRAILQDFRRSPEQRYYGALFKAVKSYEEAVRSPGTLSETENQSHIDLIDAALANLVAWVGTLPDQDPCRAFITSDDAKKAIEAAHDSLRDDAKAKSDHDISDDSRRIPIRSIMTFRRCFQTPTPSVTASPTATPTATPTETP